MVAASADLLHAIMRHIALVVPDDAATLAEALRRAGAGQVILLRRGEHAVAPYRGYVAGGTPFEQWDNMPLLAKAQIFTTIGMLESYGEGAGSPAGYVHYTKGGLPGYYPPIEGQGGAADLRGAPSSWGRRATSTSSSRSTTRWARRPARPHP